MLTNRSFWKVMPAGRALLLGLIITLAIIVTTGFVWMQRVQVIAPPSLRVLDWLWSVFVCRCPA